MLQRLPYLLLVFLLLFSSKNQANAQVKLGKSIQLTGQLNFQYSYYRDTAINGGFGAPQRPTHFPQFNGRFSINHKSGLRIPFDLTLNPLIQVTGAINTPMEGPKSLSIFQYLAHPTNNIYFHPSYKNVNLHVGHFIRPYSSLSVGDIKVFGVGSDYKKGDWKFAAQYGIIQPRVLNVLFNFNNGAYRRTLTAFSVSRNHSKKLTYGLALALAGDQINSLETAPTFTTPQKSGVLSGESTYRWNKNTSIHVELANSSWAPNAGLGDSSRSFGLTNSFLPNTSLVGGNAISIDGKHKVKNVLLHGKLGYRSKNFRTLAYPYMQSDLFEIEVGSNFIGLKKKLQTQATVGYKTSNVSKSVASAIRIPIVKLSSIYKVNKKLSVTGIYAFNAVRSSPDTSKPSIHINNQVIRFLPSYQFTKFGFKNIVSGVLGASQYVNASDAFPMPFKTTTNNLGLIYRAIIGKHSAGISVNSMNTRANGSAQLTYQSIMFNASTKQLKNKLSPFIRVSLTNSFSQKVKTGNKKVLQFGTQYVVSKKMSGSLGISIQNHKQAFITDAPAYRELLGRVGLNYRL